MSTLIKPIITDAAEQSGLSKYNRTRMPGCSEVFFAGMNEDDSFITGLTKEEVEEYSEILKRDLTPRSDFWAHFSVTIPADTTKSFNLTGNLVDKISYKMLVANGYLAPSEEAAVSDRRFLNARYYAYTVENKDKQEGGNRLKKDQAIGKLADISSNKNRMILYGQYLEGLTYHEGLGTDTLFLMLRSFIEKNVENAEKFLDVYNKPIEEVQQKILIDKAIKRGLILRTKAGKKDVYQYGQVTLGVNLKEVYKNLGSPEFAPELSTIKDELES